MVPHRLRLSSLSLSLPQDCAKPPSYPPVQRSEGRLMTVLEILKPASSRAVHVFDDYLKASPVVALRLSPDRVLQLLQALRAWPFQPLLEVVPEEVKPGLLHPGIHDPRLLRMKRQSGFRRPSLHLFKRFFGFSSAPAHNDKVIRVSHHLVSKLGHLVVKLVQVDVTQQRADHRSLRRPSFGAPAHHRVHHFLRQVPSQHLYHSSIRHFLLHSRHQPLVRDRVEVALQVRIYNPVIPCFKQSVHSPKRSFASSLRSESVTLFGKIPLKDRLQYVSQCGLRYPVAHRRDSQRPLLAAPGFLYPRSLYRSRPISSACKLRGHLRQVLDQLALEHLDRLVVYSCSAFS